MVISFADRHILLIFLSEDVDCLHVFIKQYAVEVIEDATKSTKVKIRYFWTLSALFRKVGDQRGDTGQLINASFSTHHENIPI